METRELDTGELYCRLVRGSAASAIRDLRLRLGEGIGVLQLLSPVDGGFGDEEFPRARESAGPLAHALAKARLFAEGRFRLEEGERLAASLSECRRRGYNPANL